MAGDRSENKLMHCRFTGTVVMIPWGSSYILTTTGGPQEFRVAWTCNSNAEHVLYSKSSIMHAPAYVRVRKFQKHILPWSIVSQTKFTNCLLAE